MSEPFTQALAFYQQGDHATARTLLESTLRDTPDHLDALILSGLVHRALGAVEEAIRSLDRAVNLVPDDWRAGFYLVELSLETGRSEAALARSLALTDRHGSRWNLAVQQAEVLTRLGRLADAKDLLEPLAAAHPGEPLIWDRLGVVRGLTGDYAGATEAFQAQGRLAPTGPAYANLAAALGKQRLWAQAADAGREAVRLDPRSANAWANLGNALRDLGQLADAQHALTTALTIDPSHAEALGNLALAHLMAGAADVAGPLFERVAANPRATAEVRFNRALCLLTLGDYPSGFREYEWRFRTRQFRMTPPAGVPRWQGETLAGRTILVEAEQGLGDTLQFCRFVPTLSSTGVTVVFAVQPPLVTMLGRLPGVRVVPTTDPRPACDFWEPLLSLPGLLGVTLDTLPGVPDCFARPRPEPSAGPLKVGLAWQGNPGHAGDRFRSVPLSTLSPLFDGVGVEWVSLQVGHGAEQATAWPGLATPLAETPEDFLATAAVVGSLDLVITVDTAIAHLAANLQVPTWVMLGVNADWRWLAARRNSPWYPAVRLVRQPRPGDWPGVVREVVTALNALQGMDRGDTGG